MVSVRPSAVSLQAGPVDILDVDNPGNHEMLCNFIAKYVMKIYGVKMINDWLKKNKVGGSAQTEPAKKVCSLKSTVRDHERKVKINASSREDDDAVSTS